MSHTNQWAVGYTVYLDDRLSETMTNLEHLETVVTAFQFDQAEAMIRAQYNNRVRIWYCRPA